MKSIVHDRQYSCHMAREWRRSLLKSINNSMGINSSDIEDLKLIEIS